MRALRGAAIGMVFQEPMVSLNPALTVGMQLAEGLRLHRGLPRDEIRERSLALLRRVQIADPERRPAAHPPAFSGGMQHRTRATLGAGMSVYVRGRRRGRRTM